MGGDGGGDADFVAVGLGGCGVDQSVGLAFGRQRDAGVKRGAERADLLEALAQPAAHRGGKRT